MPMANYILFKTKYLKLFNKWVEITASPPPPSFFHPVLYSLWNHKQIIGNGHLFPSAPMTNEIDIMGP